MQGDIAKVADRSAESLAGAAVGQPTVAGMVVDGAKWAANKARRINEKQAIKAMNE